MRLLPHSDRRFEILQPMVAARRLQPQRQAGDLDRFRIEVDTVQILGDDLVEDIEVDFDAELVQAAHGVAVAPRQLVEGRDQEMARTAGGIDDGEIAESGESGLPEGDFALGSGAGSPAFASRMPCAAQSAARRSSSERAMVRSTRKRVTMSGR